MNFVWATASHQGRVRSNNQDTAHPPVSGASDGKQAIVAIADGMGGAAGGEVASATAMAAAVGIDATPTKRIEAANEAVFAESRATPGLEGMGTTMTLALLGPGEVAHFGHVGDSRAYLIRDGDIRQLTADHTIVAEWVALGVISAEEAATHPRRGMLTRSVGVAPDVAVDAFDVELRPADRLIFCSDGLNGMISDNLILSIGSSGMPEAAAWALVEAANGAGGHDNITVVVVDVSA